MNIPDDALGRVHIECAHRKQASTGTTMQGVAKSMEGRLGHLLILIIKIQATILTKWCR